MRTTKPLNSSAPIAGEAILTVFLLVGHNGGIDGKSEENLGAFIDLPVARAAAISLAQRGFTSHIEHVPMATPMDAGVKQVGEKVYVNEQDYDRAMLDQINAERAARLGTKAESAPAAVSTVEAATVAVEVINRAPLKTAATRAEAAAEASRRAINRARRALGKAAKDAQATA